VWHEYGELCREWEQSRAMDMDMDNEHSILRRDNLIFISLTMGGLFAISLFCYFSILLFLYFAISLFAIFLLFLFLILLTSFLFVLLFGLGYWDIAMRYF
jgi:hypothetical protein